MEKCHEYFKGALVYAKQNLEQLDPKFEGRGSHLPMCLSQTYGIYIVVKWIEASQTFLKSLYAINLILILIV